MARNMERVLFLFLPFLDFSALLVSVDQARIALARQTSQPFQASLSFRVIKGDFALVPL